MSTMTPDETRDIARIAGEAWADARTVRRWWTWLPIRAISAHRIEAAAAELGIERPPRPRKRRATGGRR